MFKKIFVTGGAGFIGSNFIHYMQNKYKNLEILNYDALTYASNLKNLDGLDSSRHSFLKGDIRNQQQLLTAITAFKPDAMVAFAAETHVDNSIKSPSVFLETNILGTENILKAALDQNIKKLIHISTDEVYGSLPHPKEATEEFPFVTNSPYSASKAAGELVSNSNLFFLENLRKL